MFYAYTAAVAFDNMQIAHLNMYVEQVYRYTRRLRNRNFVLVEKTASFELTTGIQHQKVIAIDRRKASKKPAIFSY